MKTILDPCCGSRMWWFDKQHPDVVFGDKRTEVCTVTDNSPRNHSGSRTIRIEPDALFDFRNLPFADGAFKLVAFDPPHLVQAGPRSWLAAKYGKLGNDWRDDLRQGFAECFRVLASGGVLGADGDEHGFEQLQRDAIAEIERLRTEAAKSERRAITFGDLMHHQILAMRAAVVDGRLRSLECGMAWIENTLCGPGHLPDIDAACAEGGAQCMFDREVAEQVAFRAAHPAP